MESPTDDYEILVIDNNSSDETKKVIEEKIDKYAFNIRYFFERKPGLHNARHRGAKEAKGKILCYLDDDVTVEKYWLVGIVETFKNTDAVLVGGRVLPNYEITPSSWINKFWTTIDDSRFLGILSLFDGGNDIKELDPSFICGCNFSIKKEVLFECKGFNPDSMPWELIKYRGDGETGLSIKIKEKGYKSYYNPKICVYHFIPKERLTVEYFCQRMFMQGISDSFTEIRRSKGIKDPIMIRVRDAYEKGKIFHHEEVLNDPELLARVLKDNFMNE